MYSLFMYINLGDIMIEIGISKISKSFSFDKIFDNLSFDVKKRKNYINR